MIHTTLRRALRSVGQQLPFLRRFSGRLGLGRLLTAGNSVAQIKVDEDILIELDLSVPIFRYIYFHHDLSTAVETQLIKRLVRPTHTFVDVGAHVGYFALAAAKYGQRVLAFEASGKTFTHLQRNLALNPRLSHKIAAFQCALADKPGQLQLFNSASDPSTASLRPIQDTGLFEESVSVNTLDHFLGEQPVDFLKIDVEGGEFDVLRGATASIEKHHPLIFCELIERFQQRFGHSCADIASFLSKRGYQGFKLGDVESDKSLTLHPLNLDQLRDTEINNALFVPTAKVGAVFTALAS